MNDVQIANWLNNNGHKTPRGNIFRNNYVHSIVKKRKRRLENLQNKVYKRLQLQKNWVLVVQLFIVHWRFRL